MNEDFNQPIDMSSVQNKTAIATQEKPKFKFKLRKSVQIVIKNAPKLKIYREKTAENESFDNSLNTSTINRYNINKRYIIQSQQQTINDRHLAFAHSTHISNQNTKNLNLFVKRGITGLVS